MADFPNPASQEPRKESPGEAAQRLAGTITEGLRLYVRINLTPNQQNALATVLDPLLSWWRVQVKKVTKGGTE